MSHYHRGPPYPHRDNSYMHRQNSQPIPRGPPPMNQQMSNMPPPPNQQQQQYMAQQQQRQHQNQNSSSIPAFNPEEYAGFRELILAASVPETHQGEKSSTSQLQAIVEESVEMNGKVMDSLLAVANCLQVQNDFLAKPPFLTHDQFVIERENMKLDVVQNFEGLMNQPIYEIMGIDQI